MNELILTAKRKEILDKLGIYDIDDLIHYYPYRYENNTLMKYKEFVLNEKVCFKAKIISNPKTFRYAKNKSINKFDVLIDNEIIHCSIYNRKWLNLNLEKEIFLIGKFLIGNKLQVINYSQDEESYMFNGIVANYPLKQGINQKDIHNIFIKNKMIIYNSIIEHIPLKYRELHQLIDKKNAIMNIHFPDKMEDFYKAVSYLKYEEFLKFYLTLKILKENIVGIKKNKVINFQKVNNFIQNLEFDLTSDQIKAINEIINDISSEKTMYRLLQGDVGCGKTIVAFISLYANYLSGYQGALMAPTEILAKQHYYNFKDLFKDEIVVELFYSGLNNFQKQKIIERIKNNEIDIIIGTHSLFQDGIEYNNLGLAISDEQHRFGVKQRRKLKNKGASVDFLLMSATPIPRTLASSIYGDMDISTISSLPNERKGCDSYFIKENSIKSIIPEIIKTLNNNNQIYIVAAAISKNEMNVKDAETLYLSIKKLFKNRMIGLLHGKMDIITKEKVMKDFLEQKIDILISTTVIEVGVNNKNATMMIVYDADRFGLSQLHQLRGRVQRGSFKGSFYMLSDKNDSDVKFRMDALVNSNDGFYIANQDLKLRGPGDMLGFRQSGLPNLVLGNFIDDQKFIIKAKNDADEILNEDNLENRKIINYITVKYLKNVID